MSTKLLTLRQQLKKEEDARADAICRMRDEGMTLAEISEEVKRLYGQKISRQRVFAILKAREIKAK